MNKKTIFKIIFFIIISILGVNQTTEINAEIIEINNTNYSIQLIVEPICGEVQDKIFRIERINYTTGIQSEEINYTTTCNNKTINITKEIKKYSESKTGLCTFIQTKNYSLLFEHQHKKIEWNISVNCEEEEEIIIEPVCIEEIEMNLNQELFRKDEQLTIDFSLKNNPDFLEIEYWIETINGTILKSKRTTQNIDTKKHTFKTITQEEQGAYVNAHIVDNCSKRELKKLIVLQGEKTKEEILNEEPILKITNLKQYDENNIELTLTARRGNSRSSVIYIEIENDKSKKIHSEKLTLEKQYSEITLRSILPIENEKEITIYVHGLGLIDEQNIILDAKEKTTEILNTHTKQKYYTNNLSWYVRTKQEMPSIIKITTLIDEEIKLISKTGELTSEFNILYDGGPIQTTILNTEGNITQTDQLNLQKKETKQEEKESKEEQVVPNLITQEENTSKITKPIQMKLEKEEISSLTTSRKALYGLFGSVLAGSTYLLLKEQ